MTHQDHGAAADWDDDHPRPHALEMPPETPAPSDEALAAIEATASALARAAQTEVAMQRVCRRERQLTVANHFVLAFERALGVRT